MPRVETWSQLKVGIATSAVIIGIVAAVLIFARVGALHGSTTRLYMVTDMASGVLDGTEVRLAGQKVGLVRAVELRPVSNDTTERVAITMDVLSPYVKFIRRNSDVQIRPGGRLIGSPVVYIGMGTDNVPGVQEGDTLRAQAQLEARSGLADASSLGDSLTNIVATVSTIRAEFDSTAHDVAGLDSLSRLQARAVRTAVRQLAHRATASQGSIAGVMHGNSYLESRVAHISAVADSIALAAHGSGNMGRFRRDSALVIEARRTIASAEQLRASIYRYAGTSSDGAALARQVDLAHSRLDSIVQDARRHPLRYITF